MKKILAIILVIFSVSSCTKQLEKFPQGKLTEDNVFTQPNDFLMAIDAAYLPLTNRFRGDWDWDNGSSIPRDWVIGDVMSDDAVKGGGSLGDQEDMRRMQTFSIFPENNNVLGVWRFNYKGVDAANTLLSQDGSKVAGLDAALWKRMQGEAYFLRAFYYFRLVINFGDIPLLIPEKNLKDNSVRTPVAQVYEQIESDLKQAMTLLPLSYIDNDNYHRATTGAAHALLAKTFLYRKRWQDCLNEIAEVEKGNYILLDKFADNFNGAGERMGEIIFAARHESGKTPSQGSVLNAVFAPQGKGWGFEIPTKDLVNAFEPGDPRIAATLFQAGDVYLDGTNYDPTWSPITGYNVRKFMSNVSPIDDGGVDFIYIRLADVILWKAECHANLDMPGDAKTDIERVRARARKYAANPATNLPAVTTSDKTQLLTAIQHERRVELAMEGHRYYDLVRWDLAKTVLAKAADADPLKGIHDYGNGWQTYHQLLPIPQREADLLGLKQNTGY
ncbi:RagB/SusD family nutrient uptake outer membrane protein [Chitinophaga silvatica]|uniref:RagB/SusD family nutrient uptake outer membrane protein n=1 Tax=Chitinophaga silvatica TaxID=2282649 RepID=A0A3E1YI29_9BACT|nr:RagB/SusD family nutrient uptake outer membrane protein [Chitinophaga silvatica]RFS26997.1 RagB/SusD family nutrient uptake outer membrane protein [Chitinophaga silvatica]